MAVRSTMQAQGKRLMQSQQAGDYPENVKAPAGKAEASSKTEHVKIHNQIVSIKNWEHSREKLGEKIIIAEGQPYEFNQFDPAISLPIILRPSGKISHLPERIRLKDFEVAIADAYLAFNLVGKEFLLLLRYAIGIYSQDGYKYPLNIRFHKNETWAELIKVDERNVSRIFTVLKDRGIIRVFGKKDTMMQYVFSDGFVNWLHTREKFDPVKPVARKKPGPKKGASKKPKPYSNTVLSTPPEQHPKSVDNVDKWHPIPYCNTVGHRIVIRSDTVFYYGPIPYCVMGCSYIEDSLLITPKKFIPNNSSPNKPNSVDNSETQYELSAPVVRLSHFFAENQAANAIAFYSKLKPGPLAKLDSFMDFLDERKMSDMSTHEMNKTWLLWFDKQLPGT